MARITLRIASLDCDIPVPDVYDERGFYSDIFESILKKASRKQRTYVGKDVDISFKRYNCLVGEFPSQQDLKQIDGIIITGSAFSAYDDVPWVKSLIALCRDLYENHHEIKIFGSCFGHQLLAHALLSPYLDETCVSKDPAGWEIGIHSVALSPQFLSHFGPVTSNPSAPSHLRIQFVHADYVSVPLTLLQQQGFVPVGASLQCGLQGLWKQGRVLTYQGHAEFDKYVNSETLKVFGRGVWTEEFMEKSLGMVDDGDDDAIWAAGVMLKFFLEDAEGIGEEGKGSVEESSAAALSLPSLLFSGSILHWVRECFSVVSRVCSLLAS